MSSAISLDGRTLGPGHALMHVDDDDERATGVGLLASLQGKTFDVGTSRGRSVLTDASGAPVPEDQAMRAKPLAALVLGWPGPDVARHVPPPGSEVRSLEHVVEAVADVPLHGSPADETKAVVTFAGSVRGPATDELTFDVVLTAWEGDAGMCHRWRSDAALHGTLRLRADDGALLSLHLRGPVKDTEALCQDPSGKPGPPPPPQRCDEGDVSVDIETRAP